MSFMPTRSVCKSYPASWFVSESNRFPGEYAAEIETMREILGIRIPDSKIAEASFKLMEDSSPKHLCRHCLRTFVLGSLALRKAGKSFFDEELAYIACVGHDLGLTETHSDNAVRFEVAGADATADLMQRHGETEERVQTVWTAIALHATPGLPERFSPEAALVAMGAGIDVAGVGLDAFSPQELGALIEAYPRDGFTEGFRDLVVSKALASPISHLFTWAGDLARSSDSRWPCPSAATLMTNNRWTLHDAGVPNKEQ